MIICNICIILIRDEHDFNIFKYYTIRRPNKIILNSVQS